jgi:hypothetical protein
MTGIEFHVEGAVGQFALGRSLKIGAIEQQRTARLHLDF